MRRRQGGYVPRLRATITRVVLVNQVLHFFQFQDAFVYFDLRRGQWTEDNLVDLLRKLWSSCIVRRIDILQIL